MLHEWLRPLSVGEFRETHLGRGPFARPGAAASALAQLTWNVLGSILESRPAPDVLVARDGRLAAVPPPRNLRAARELLDRKLGVVVLEAERHHDGFAQLARSFARDMPGEVHIQLYATPAGTRTFGWHFDSEDVFIAQTEGTKEYYMRANTVLTSSSPGLDPDFGAVRRETSPLLSARLIPGDWLYIPSRWWHLVHSNEDALSISIGVLPRRLIDTGPRAHEAAV
jgi:hypothetical protein